MNTEVIKRIGKAGVRALAVLALTEVTALLFRLLFAENLFGGTYVSDRVLNVGYTFVFLLIFQSMVIALYAADGHARERCLTRAGDGGFLSTLKCVLTSPDGYADMAVITLLSLFLPTSFLYGFAVGAFFDGSGMTEARQNLYTLLIFLPLLFFVDLLARVSVVKKWWRDSHGVPDGHLRNRKFPPAIKNVLSAMLAYVGLALVVAWMSPVLVTVYHIAGGIGYLWILAALIAVPVLIVLFFVLRAVVRRKRFLRKLRKYCRTHAVDLSGIHRPYRSLGRQVPGYTFRLVKDGVTYDCKLLAGVFPHAPMVLSDTGEGLVQHTVKVFRVEWFRVLKRLDFAFESEGRKVLILLPAPGKWFASTKGGAPRPADTGERIGEYIACTATGFLNALDHGCL